MKVVTASGHLKAVVIIITIWICLLRPGNAADDHTNGQSNKRNIQVAVDHFLKLTKSTGHQSKGDGSNNKCRQALLKNCQTDHDSTEMTTASGVKTTRNKRSAVMTGDDEGYRSVRRGGGGGLDRNFLRFGRKGGGLNKNFLRFGRGGLDKNFLRFGRNSFQLGTLDNGQVDANKIDQVLENFRRTQQQEEEDEMANPASLEENSDYIGANNDPEVDNVQFDQLKTKRGSLNNNFLRYGRYNPDALNGKRGSLDRNFLRFGKRSLVDKAGHPQDDQRSNHKGPNIEHLVIPCNSGQDCDTLTTAPPGDQFGKLVKKRSLLDGHWMTATNDQRRNEEEGEDNGHSYSIRRRSVDNSVLEGGLQENFIRFGKR